jgi:transcriptional regulator with XRE-family HTH domain
VYEVKAVVRAARDRVGLTQQQLAAASGIAQAQIARYESGAAIPTVRVLDRLLGSCGLQVRFELEHRHADLDGAIEAHLALPIDRRFNGFGRGAHALLDMRSLVRSGAVLCGVGHFAASLHGAPLDAPTARCVCRKRDLPALNAAIRRIRLGADYREDGTIGFFGVEIAIKESWPQEGTRSARRPRRRRGAG